MDKIIEQWEQATESSLAALGQFAEYSADEAGQMTGTMFNMQYFARIGKTYLHANNELNKIGTSCMNNMVRNSLSLMDLHKPAEAVRELEQIRSDAAARILENQTKFIQIFMDSGIDCLETLKKSRGVNDLLTTQVHMLTEIQEKAKENMFESIALSEGAANAMKGWMEKTMNSLSGGSDKIPEMG